MPNRGQWNVAHAVVTDLAVSKHIPAGAYEPVVVHGGYDRHSSAPAGVEDGRAQQGKGVVHVDDVGTDVLQDTTERTPDFVTPHDLTRNERPRAKGPTSNVIAEPFESFDRMAIGRKGVRLLIDDPVLAARRCGAVPVVYEQYVHARVEAGLLCLPGVVAMEAEKKQRRRLLVTSCSFGRGIAVRVLIGALGGCRFFRGWR